MPPFSTPSASSPTEDNSNTLMSATTSDGACHSNSLGPSRRPTSKLLALATHTRKMQNADDLEERYPKTPPHKHREAPKRFTFSSAPKTLPFRRHIPFFVWVLAISSCFCTLYLNMLSLRAPKPLIKKNESAKEQKSQQNLRNLEENSDLTKPEQKAIIADSSPETEFRLPKDIIHLVQTRFMQDQSDLLELGFARLALFEAFCLPSLKSQSNKNFLWIIRTDPHLHPSMLDKLINLLEDRPNFVLLGSNYNPEGFDRNSGSFNDFLRASKHSEATAPVWNGNITLVQEAYERSAAGAVLVETRLDSDDAIHRDFVKLVQRQAGRSLVKRSTEADNGDLWRLWCIHANVEWHPFNPYPYDPKIEESIAKDGNRSKEEGYLVMYADGNTCVTPGLTFGYGAGASRSSIPGGHLRHDQIVKRIQPCKEVSKEPSNIQNSSNDTEVSCVSRLNQLIPGAVRTRTTTSAGMNNVFTGDNEVDQNVGLKALKGSKQQQVAKQYFKQIQLWKALQTFFSISFESAKDARWLIVDRMQEIAEDNLRGQCTPGHSCKNDTKNLLKIVSS